MLNNTLSLRVNSANHSELYLTNRYGKVVQITPVSGCTREAFTNSLTLLAEQHPQALGAHYVYNPEWDHVAKGAFTVADYVEMMVFDHQLQTQ